MVDVTIIVPTYFGGNMLYNCIDSIHKAVTNPKILVYKNDIGWLKACNEAMQSVTGDVILLNDDTFVLTDIIAEMSNLAYSKDEIGIVGGKALSAANPDTIINYGIYVGVDGNTAHKHFGRPRDSVGIETQKAVEGSCIYIKRAVLDEVGYFDEAFGMGYREEVDHQFRAREAGWKVVSCPTAEYIHYVSQTHSKVGINNDKYTYFMEKWGKKLKLGIV
jgi:GT2 family glycosyltransferase